MTTSVKLFYNDPYHTKGNAQPTQEWQGRDIPQEMHGQITAWAQQNNNIEIVKIEQYDCAGVTTPTRKVVSVWFNKERKKKAPVKAIPRVTISYPGRLRSV